MNTIVVLADTLRRDHLGCYGNSPVKTPNMDRFAQRATVFDQSYVSSYPCMPARQDLWTGQLSFLKRGWAPLEYDEPDLVTLLKENGVRTALMTDHYHYWQYGAENYHVGFDACEMVRGQENDNFHTGDETTVQYPAPREKLNDRWTRYYFNTRDRRCDEDYFTAQVFRNAVQWLDDNRDGTDQYMLIDCFDPHEPFDPPLAYAKPYLPQCEGDLPIWPRYGESSNYSQRELDTIHGLYCGEVAFFDHCFGKLYQWLEENDRWKDTAVIVTSDHGWLFGEHGWLGKHSSLLYNDITRTPLIIWHPALQKGRESTLVQMADLMPTILDVMGAAIPQKVQGKSLACLWNADKRSQTDALHREAVLYGVFGGEIYLTDGEYVFVKEPNQTNTPLYWYTRSHFNNWDFGQKNYWQDSVKRIEQFDGQRFPVQYPNAYPRHAAPEFAQGAGLKTCVQGKKDALFHLQDDAAQLHDLADEQPARMAHYRALMAELLERYHAPCEQLERMNLESKGETGA